MSRLGLFFLGPPEIQIDNRPVSFPTRKSTALLAYLSITDKSLPRDSLAAFLWPDLDQSRARASLRQALWMIGSAGLADWLEIDQELVGLKPGYELDVAVFHEKLAQSRAHGHPVEAACPTCISLLSEAAGLYRGDFLAGFTLRDSPEFDDWQSFQAEGLRQELAEALEQLVRLHSAGGDWESGLPHARRWVALDPLHEPAHRWLMRLYAQSGKRGLILKQYETLTQTLDQELGIEPEAETRQLYEDILAGRLPAGGARPPIPPAPPLKATAWHNIPTPLNPLIGRELEVAAICETLLRPDTHLLTLTGPPGIGKTRLSIQVASDLFERFKDGVCFIPLAPIRDADLVAITITQALGIIESGDWNATAALKEYFRGKSMLLVLDNFEQVLEAAPLVVELLQTCPRLKILATSLKPLKISAEHQYPVAPLRLPDLDRSPSLETLVKTPAIALFNERAGLVDPGFTLTAGNAAAIAKICQALDGLPLAIELAAPWIRLLPPEILLARLSSRLSLLVGGSIDLPPRQRTLRAAIDWSYGLLDSREQTLLSHLTVFAGGWTLEAAGAVVGLGSAETGAPGDVLEGLLKLVDTSLVKPVEPSQGPARFIMLETICEYATEKLIARGEQGILQQRHAAYYRELAEASEPALRGPQQQLWLALLKAEHNNLRAALQWAIDHQQAETAMKLSGSLWRYWWMHGHLSEGRDWLEKTLTLPSLELPSWRAKVLNGAGILARSQGDYVHARVFLEACLEIQRTLADRAGMAAILNSLGVLAQYQEDYDQAFQVHQESLNLRRAIGDRRDIGVSLNNLAMIAHEKGDLARAEELYRECLALLREIHDARGIETVLANWGALLNDQGDPDRAESFFRESMSILKDLGQRDDIIECLEGFAGAAALRRQPRRGARLFGASQALREVIGSPVPPYKRARNERLASRIAAQLDPQTLDSELMIGRRMSLEEAIEYALRESDEDRD